MKGLVLFDIDKTLIKSLDSHADAFKYAFKKVYNVDASINIIYHCGMTDQQIILEVLKKKGFTEKEIFLKINICIDIMLKYFNRVKKNFDVEVLDGVHELLEELSKQDFIIGLVTGNLEDIGKIKMRKAGLDKYFKVGGFGSDDISRANLVRIAVKRAEKKFDFKVKDNVFVFGDTPRDIFAGKESGVYTFGVLTGNYSRKDLVNAGANYVFDDLKDTKNILDVLSNRTFKKTLFDSLYAF